MKTYSRFGPTLRVAARLPLLLALCALIALVLLATCADEGDDDDDGQAQNDDCGYAIVEVPEGCDACHGAPPLTSRHPDNPRCSRCHGFVVDEQFNFVQPELHNNGVVEYAVGCTSCHGWDQDVSPPQNLRGECAVDAQGVGAHAGMRRDAIDAHKVNCINCHAVPLGTWTAGHIDGDGLAEVTFSSMAVQGGAQPGYDGETCSNVYCHGATLTGGDHKNPSFWDQSGQASRCGACHRLTDPQGNAGADCHSCHPQSVDESQQILPLGEHINGQIDMADEE